jgi:hypothetical protein
MKKKRSLHTFIAVNEHHERKKTIMPDTNYNDMPSACCPHCDQSFQWDDYYDLAVGDERDCPLCEKNIHVTTVDHIMMVTLSTDKPE